MYGTIRMHQDREYPARISGTTLVNPDFAALARAYGGHGETVEKTEDFAEDFRRAQASNKQAHIALKLDQAALNPRASLSQIRAAGIQERAQPRERSGEGQEEEKCVHKGKHR